MITVYAAYNTPFDGKGIVRDFRVLWALEELGLPYDRHWIDAGKGEQKIDPNRAINPFGKIPSISDGDFKLFESGAVVYYLFEKAGKLPSDAKTKTQLLQWMFAALNTVEPPLLDLLVWNLFWKDRAGRDVRYPEVIEASKTRLAELEKVLAGKSYLLGEAFSPADILMVTVLDFGKIEPSIYASAPQVRAYLERCKGRTGYTTAFAKHLVGPAAKAA